MLLNRKEEKKAQKIPLHVNFLPAVCTNSGNRVNFIGFNSKLRFDHVNFYCANFLAFIIILLIFTAPNQEEY